MKKRNAVIALVVMIAIYFGLGFLSIHGTGNDGTGSISDIKLGLDLAGGVSITYEAVGEEEPTAEDMDDTIYKLQRRVEQYSTEAQVYKEGSDRINIEIPGVTDANAILEQLGRPGSLYFIRQHDADGNENYSFNASSYGYSLNKTIAQLIESGDAILSGTDVVDAQAGYQSDSMQNQQIVVELIFSEDGAKVFADATKVAYENNETIAIYYDGEFISVPRVSAVITDGRAIITGEPTIDSAKNLAATIRIGGLKVELEELRSKVVGAQLGEEALSTSMKAGIIGMVLVMAFMIAIYWLPGLCAALALVLYAFLMIVILVGFEVTLTLPGIAGILLSIGMAVDANVIIFARIREELATGKTVQSAMKLGYSKALSAIIDGNITTLIAAAVLGIKGSGSVKGFAQTLAIGIILSMITALFITRLFMNIAFALGFTDVKYYGVGKKPKFIPVLENRKKFFIVSGALVVIGLVVMMINGARGVRALNYSLDFVGGTSTNVTFEEDYTLAQLDQEMVPVFEEITGDANVQVQKVAGTDEVIVKTRTLTVEEREDLKDKLIEKYGIKEKSIAFETISSTISSEMRRDALIAVVIALILMLLYIWFRFSDVRFGAASVMALAHDVLVVLAFYAVFRVSVGSTFIACMLTIVGYSINATIVIFDRVRENFKAEGKGASLVDVLNNSISQTLSRSIFTSLTTFFMVFTLFIFGVSSIREFALPIGVGIICGTYSSICLACAFWYVLRVYVKKKESPEEPQKKSAK
ncbi:MAG: protein translocase subunit SecD [Lachnospiraceae bacterium]|nr:protein translocase subunit SecD [Lachnospiraceae bacterium]